ncbi:hypothetical protein GSI_13544 [Ganoderma sinense ZZ0214-1]|uniref:DNA recombination and repair protein Rad51-like C-terminal domain-containing protein n=1 Tax=Ganoderma sinense ZZ0214-1 TaxID=1077348 RepID=A0A2G8RQL1_9APHY|nr:hypothetical protein GSI_13544 [Ganoderma sinense ZZ0214-1]
MENRYLANLTSLSMPDKVALTKANVQTVSDLLLKPPSDLVKRCKGWGLTEINTIVDLVCNELREEPTTILHDGTYLKHHIFTTAGSQLDEALGGGFRTGMVWEICGENLSDIHTLKATNFGTLTRILTDLFPTFANSRASVAGVKPAKLIIIDTFTDLFDSSRHPEYEDLKQRARDLRQASLLLHQIASSYQLAVVLLGSTRTSHPRFDGQDHSPGELSCDDQERWFSRGRSLRGEETHEALLGPIWSNQLNARIMMTRTLRMRSRHEVDPRIRDSEDARTAKRRRLDSTQASSIATSLQAAGDEQLAFRHLSIVFSSVAPPASCDYVILEQGLVAFPPEEPPPSTFLYASPAASQTSSTTWSSQAGVPLVPNLHPRPPDERSVTAAVEEEDEEESLWRLTQEQGDLFDQLAQEEEKAVEAEEGPPAEDHGASSDSDFYWDD